MNIKYYLNAHLYFIMFRTGYCVDLETTIASRVPDAVRPKGQKRFETRIIEVGAVHVTDVTRKWGCLVNPLPRDARLDNVLDLFALLRDMYQRPDATINFWSKVLVQRRSVTANMFLKNEPPQVWLNRTTTNRAKDFVRWYNEPETGPKFVTETEALRGLLDFTHEQPTWYAHNGRSFDFKILKGCGLRCGIDYTVNEIDTLREFRKLIPGHKSYSQPLLYRALFNRGYNAHVAIDDATALSELCSFVHGKETTVVSPTSEKPIKMVSPLLLPAAAMITHKAMNLTFRRSNKENNSVPVTKLRGIGPKSSRALSEVNIFTCAQLKKEFNKHGVDWLRKVMPKGVRWRVVAHSISSFMV